MKMRFYFVLLGICFLMPCTSDATTFPTPNQPFSKYGQIQNVQNYSSNPFWTPDSPYNQRMPVPVYVQGPDVTTADCQRVVSALIESYCASRNNCMDISLTDINPTITVQLASLPGHNFVTPCAAYIQPTFETYKKNNSNAAPTGQAVAFPEALVPNPDVTNNKKNNTDVASPPQKSNWQTEMRAREEELKRLQAQNSPGSNEVIKTDFPATFADLSFEQKQQVLASGYAPYKDKSAYKPINNIIDDTTSAQSDASSNNGEAPIDKTSTVTDKNKKTKDDNTTNNTQEHSYTQRLTASNVNPFAAASLFAYTTDSDCLKDPITNQMTCCNTILEKADRRVNIGGIMFCGQEERNVNGAIARILPVYGFVRQCVQGEDKATKAASPISGAFKKDFWNQECIPNICNNGTAPSSSISNDIITWKADTTNYCWEWDCANGYTKQHNKCIKNKN